MSSKIIHYGVMRVFWRRKLGAKK